MRPEARNLELESERVYVVYDGKSGTIAHVHRIWVHRGATQVSDDEGEKRALLMAQRFGHTPAKLRVLSAASFEGGVGQRVNVKTREVVAAKAAPGTKAAKKRASAARRRG
jgi:hypothetical protein